MKALEPADALLVIDVGNTRLGMAVSDGDGVHDVRRVAAAERGTWRPALTATWSAVEAGGNRAVVISSVCPEIGRDVFELAGVVCGVEPLRIRDDIPLPLPLEIENPREIGVDRICAAAAAFDRLGTACAVASFGTAFTVDCVSDEGRFLGGTILPGLDLSCLALHEHTAALPRVSPGTPAGPFGRNTNDAIVSGVAFGAVGALREIVERFATELGVWPQLVVTGGDAPLIMELADFVDAVVPDLCLMGIALAYQRAAATP